MIHQKSAGAVIFFRRQEKIEYLLVKSTYWGFVKGRIEPDEKETDTVLREALEETGLKDLKFISGFKETSRWKYRRKPPEGFRALIDKEAVFYLLESLNKEVQLSPEHTDYVWLEFAKAYDQLTFKDSKEILKKADIKLKLKN